MTFFKLWKLGDFFWKIAEAVQKKNFVEQQ